MKILIVSLLRLGDVLLSASVLRGLRREYPSAELHLLINGQFKAVSSLIPHVNRVYSFDRHALQEIIGMPEHNLLEAYFRVEDLVEKLKSENYDKVINLTHNRLSGWLTTLVGCPDTKGVMFNTGGKFSAGSNWFEYLNEVGTSKQQNAFHFIDIFHYGTGLEGKDRRIELKETSEGAAFAAKLFQNANKQKRIVIQPCSSESKKTFGSSQWRSIIQNITATETEHGVYVLGAPSERQMIDEICAGANCVPVICALDEAFSVIKNSQLLVTVDTSIKHLATATPVKILEISLGSSEYRKTGAYTQGAVILQGLAPCVPCSHRGVCTQRTHECAEKISPELVALSASAMLRRDDGALRMLAGEFKDEALIMKTSINAAGDWTAFPMMRPFSFDEISPWIDRTSQKLFLQKAHEKPVGEYGTEGLHLKHLLQNIFPDQSWREWISELKVLEKDVSWFETELGNFLNRLKQLLGALDSPSELAAFTGDLESFCHDLENSTVLSSYCQQILLAVVDSKDTRFPFHVVKSLREKLTVAHQRTRIELKLIRSLQSGFMEIV